MIKKVAVIGGGPAGIYCVYEFLKTQSENYGITCVGFEAKSDLGGVWSDTPGENLDSPTVFDQLAKLPDPTIAQDARTIFYDNSPLINPRDGSIQLKNLSGTGVNRPLKLARKETVRNGVFFSKKTGLYDDFVSNAPQEMMDFAKDPGSVVKSNLEISPLTDLTTIKSMISQFVDRNKLQSQYRMNTSVEYLDKFGPNKYIIAAKKSETGKNYDEWYLESFDAVILANGHFLVPYIPYYMSQPKGGELASTTIHQFNKKFPGVLVHFRDIDRWYNEVLPRLPEKSKYKRLVIVGKSFSCMDALKKIQYLHDNSEESYEIIISTNREPMPDERNPFKWFDEWLLSSNRVIIRSQIKEFDIQSETPQIKFVDDDSHYLKVDYVLFATGYLYNFPFVSPLLLESCRIFITPDPRNDDSQPSSISRVTGLYLHTFSIAEPTLAFCGISSNGNFQSFEISAKAIAGAFVKFNKLSLEHQPVDFPHYDSIWSQILPPIREQLIWSQNRLLHTGNSGAFHYYHPLQLLFQEWLEPCRKLFQAGEQVQFPPKSQELMNAGYRKLQQLFQNAADDSSSS